MLMCLGGASGVDGSRTHRGPFNDPPPVLKTEEPTGAQPPPGSARIPYGPRGDKITLPSRQKIR